MWKLGKIRVGTWELGELDHENNGKLESWKINNLRTLKIGSLGAWKKENPKD